MTPRHTMRSMLAQQVYPGTVTIPITQSVGLIIGAVGFSLDINLMVVAGVVAFLNADHYSNPAQIKRMFHAMHESGIRVLDAYRARAVVLLLLPLAWLCLALFATTTVTAADFAGRPSGTAVVVLLGAYSQVQVVSVFVGQLVFWRARGGVRNRLVALGVVGVLLTGVAAGVCVVARGAADPNFVGIAGVLTAWTLVMLALTHVAINVRSKIDLV